MVSELAGVINQVINCSGIKDSPLFPNTYFMTPPHTHTHSIVPQKSTSNWNDPKQWLQHRGVFIVCSYSPKLYF